MNDVPHQVGIRSYGNGFKETSADDLAAIRQACGRQVRFGSFGHAGQVIKNSLHRRMFL